MHRHALFTSLLIGLSASARAEEHLASTPLCAPDESLVYIPTGEVDPTRAKACQA